jgi:hypothetical protein
MRVDPVWLALHLVLVPPRLQQIVQELCLGWNYGDGEDETKDRVGVIQNCDLEFVAGFMWIRTHPASSHREHQYPVSGMLVWGLVVKPVFHKNETSCPVGLVVGLVVSWLLSTSLPKVFFANTCWCTLRKEKLRTKKCIGFTLLYTKTLRVENQ